jgi:hypothetical protein
LENLSITLPVQAWNVILNALGQRPYVEVMELIAELKKQADAEAARVVIRTKYATMQMAIDAAASPDEIKASLGAN